MFSGGSAVPRFAKRVITSTRLATRTIQSLAGRSVSCGTTLPQTALDRGQQHRQFGTSPAGLSEGMKLLTHNMMQSHVKGIVNGYPLIIRVSEAHECNTQHVVNSIQVRCPRIEEGNCVVRVGHVLV